MTKPKILFIGTTPPPYHGVSIANKILLDSKLKNRFEIRLFDITDRRENISNWGKLDFFNVWLALKQILKLIECLIFTRFEIIYLNFSQNKLAFFRDGLFILIASIFSRGKIIGHLNGSDFKDFYERSNFLYRSFINICLKNIFTFIVVGDCLKYIFEKWSNRIEVVPNGIDFLLNINGYAQYKNKSNIRIAYLGNLFRTKGILPFIHVAQKLIQRFDNVFIDIAGGRDQSDKELNAELDAIIQVYPDRICYLGVVSGKTKEEFLKKADIFAFPPIAPEGMPFVILEAMAAQNPIVTTDQGAIKEVVIENENGFVLTPGDEKALYERLEFLILNDQERLKMGRASRRRYLSKYKGSDFVEKMIQIFEKVLSNS